MGKKNKDRIEKTTEVKYATIEIPEPSQNPFSCETMPQVPFMDVTPEEDRPLGNVKRLPKKDNRVLCIYVPNSWPFIYTKFFKNFLYVTHPSNIVKLRELGITDYFNLISNKFPVCKNRNMAVQEAKKYGADLVMFLDSDMRHPPDIIYQLAKYDLPIVSGMYFHQSPPHFPVVYKHKEGTQYNHYYNYPRNSLFTADLIGMGCVLIDTRVFDEMEMPIFYYKSSRPDGIVDTSEDVPFCEKARELGYSLVVDPKIQCTHLCVDQVTNVNFDVYLQQYKTYQSLLDKFKDGYISDGSYSDGNI